MNIPIFPNFERINLEFKNVYLKYLNKLEIIPCNSLFFTLIIYDNDDEVIKICLLNDNLIILVYNKNSPHYFGPIIGNNKIEKTVLQCLEYFKRKINFKYFPNKILNLKYLHNSISVQPDRDNYDYVYKLSELINFKKKHRQNLNNFLKNYNYNYKTIGSNDISNINKIIIFFENWYENSSNKDETARLEYYAFHKMLNYINQLDIIIGAIFINDKIIGFCMATIFNEISYSHIEKANRMYKGSYQILIKEFSLYLSKQYNIKIINREDDLGLDGLRKNKLSYNPTYFIEKANILLK